MTSLEHGGRRPKPLGLRGLLMAWGASAFIACGTFGSSGNDGEPGDVPPPGPEGGASTVDAAAPDGEAEVDATYVSPPLLAYWDFEEVAGTTVVDRSGSGRDATIENAEPDIVRGEGKYGRGISFGRRGAERLRCPASMSSLIGDGALSFWMRDDDDEPAPLGVSAGYFSNQNSNDNHLFLIRPKDRPPQDLQLGFQLGKDGGSAAVYAATHPFTVTRGVWTRVVVSWTQLEARILVGTAVEPVKVTFSQPWKANEQHSCYFGADAKVAFDEIKFFARPLTDAEMLAIP